MCRICHKNDELTAEIKINSHYRDVIAGDQGWGLNTQEYLTFQKEKQKGKGGQVGLLTKDIITAVMWTDISSEAHGA